MRLTLILLCLCSPTLVAIAKDGATESYDTHLCRTAQRLIVNADEQLPVIEQRAAGNGFHTIQMSVDTQQAAAVIAMTTRFADIDGEQLATDIACKMVNRERINDQLNRNLPGPDQPCRAVNEATYARMLDELDTEQKQRYLHEGRQLQFADDAPIATGAEWLPVAAADFVVAAGDNTFSVRSPSVRVPWDSEERNFYQGTQHCKLISLAAMRRWATQAAFEPNGTLLPIATAACKASQPTRAEVGSCRFYFAPADAMFCQDYTGPGWSRATAMAECERRHASPEALQEAGNRYEGTGGNFDTRDCETRPDSDAISGTCVFHCNEADETLWQVSSTIDPRMTRGCDLFITSD